MHVEHFMTKNPVACDASDSVRHAAGLMRDKGVGSVIVLRNGKVAGIVTDRQLACHALADGMPQETPVEQVMTEGPARLTLDDNIFSAIDTMRSAGVVKRVPVVNADNELLGVVSLSDIAVIGKDIVDAVFMDLTHEAIEETRVLTGAKRMIDTMRRPTKEERLTRRQELRAVTTPTPPGPPGPSGGAGETPAAERQAPATRAEGAREGPREGPKGFLDRLFG